MRILAFNQAQSSFGQLFQECGLAASLSTIAPDLSFFAAKRLLTIVKQLLIYRKSTVAGTVFHPPAIVLRSYTAMCTLGKPPMRVSHNDRVLQTTCGS